jgi:hypothetical protein
MNIGFTAEKGLHNSARIKNVSIVDTLVTTFIT